PCGEREALSAAASGSLPAGRGPFTCPSLRGEGKIVSNPSPGRRGPASHRAPPLQRGPHLPVSESMSAAKPLNLHPDRLFPSDPTQRSIARRLYAEVATLPIVSPHGHTDPAWWAGDEAFANATE